MTWFLGGRGIQSVTDCDEGGFWTETEWQNLGLAPLENYAKWKYTASYPWRIRPCCRARRRTVAWRTAWRRPPADIRSAVTNRRRELVACCRCCFLNPSNDHRTTLAGNDSWTTSRLADSRLYSVYQQRCPTCYLDASSDLLCSRFRTDIFRDYTARPRNHTPL